MKDKDQIELFGESEQRLEEKPGSLIIVLKEKKHSFFLRKGDDLFVEIPLNLKEAIIGFKKSIKHLDGKDMKLSKKKVTFPNETKTIKGQGMPLINSETKRGDLHLKFKVTLPETLSEEEKIFIGSLL